MCVATTTAQSLAHSSSSREFCSDAANATCACVTPRLPPSSSSSSTCASHGRVIDADSRFRPATRLLCRKSSSDQGRRTLRASDSTGIIISEQRRPSLLKERIIISLHARGKRVKIIEPDSRRRHTHSCDQERGTRLRVASLEIRSPFLSCSSLSLP